MQKKKKNVVEFTREQKWLKMLDEWPKHCNLSRNRYSEKLVSRVFKGIPDKLRHRAWPKLLDVESQIKAQPGVYDVRYFYVLF